MPTTGDSYSSITSPFLAAGWSDRYRVERVLGQGRMATVYLAEDVRHHRRVAIKVLQANVAELAGAERFLGEIRTTATLQHPHIVPLIDSGETHGVPYYVMPYIEGETLRHRLTREGQLPVHEAIRLAKEIASALDFAHRHGVVHRDIKPENVLLQDGSALVADFGIALALSSVAGQRLTETGISLGTPQYMSPEQAMAERTIDGRSDIFALGAITYEMLVGEAPFTGPTIQVVLARLATEEPRRILPLRNSVPPNVEEAVLRALAKLPADRFDTVRDFAAALSSADISRRASMASILGGWRAGALGIGLVVAGLAGWFLGREALRRDEAPYPPSRLSIVGPRIGGTGISALQRQLAITPDGQTLLYLAMTPDGRSRLMRQSLTDAEPAPVPNVREGTATPVLSADGHSFFGWAPGERAAYRYTITGGPGEPLSLPGGYTDFAQWDEHGTIWYSPRDGGALWRLDPSDTVARSIAGAARTTRFQQLLPDGRHALVMLNAGARSGPVGIADVVTGGVTPLMTTAVVEVRYAAGYLVYVLADGALEAAPFDLRDRKVTGAGVPLGTTVSLTGTGVAQLAVAPNGTLAYIVEEPPALVFVDRNGGARVALGARHDYHGPRFSPDGQRVSVDFDAADGRDVWLFSIVDGSLSRATFTHDAHDGTWTPDGQFITYLSSRSGTETIYKKRPTEIGGAEALFASSSLGFTGMWLHDGSGIVTTMSLRPGSSADIALIRNGGRGPVEPIAASEFTEAFPAVSPDGRWVAFTSDQSGQPEVYLHQTSGPSEQLRISQGGATEPAWGPSGHEVFYRTVSDTAPQLMVATLRTQPSLAVVSRRVLFPVADMIGTNPHANYDIAPDGRTFVMVRRTPASRIVVIQNLPAFVRKQSRESSR